MSEVFDARMKTPFSCIVGGAPLSGKTSFVRQLLHHRHRLIDKEFDYLVWFYGQETEFIDELRNQTIGIPTTVVHMLPPSFDEYLISGKRGLIVLDDLMQNAGSSTAVTDLFVNKIQHTNTSAILMLQNLFHHGKERTTFVRCAHYMVVFKNPLDGSVPLYLAQKIMPLRRKLFMDIFDSATGTPHGYLYIDGKQSTPTAARFRTDIFADAQTVFVITEKSSETKKKKIIKDHGNSGADSASRTGKEGEEEEEEAEVKDHPLGYQAQRLSLAALQNQKCGQTQQTG